MSTRDSAKEKRNCRYSVTATEKVQIKIGAMGAVRICSLLTRGPFKRLLTAGKMLFLHLVVHFFNLFYLLPKGTGYKR